MHSALTILIVDDEENARVMLAQMVELIGHRPLLARDGEEALALYRGAAPDVVLMDVMMPGLDGYQTTVRLRACGGDTWVPVVFLSALPRAVNLLRALEAGGDDYLDKPVSLNELHAKLRALERVAVLQRRLRAKRDELEYHYQRAEEEARIGAHLMESLTSMAGLRDETVRFWTHPVQRFSGDLVAAARTPANVLHLLVADAVGHGLPAALNVLPLADAFYGMTAEGCALERIVDELNRRIRRLLPVDRFVCATLVAVDLYRQELRIWNGGNPAPLFVASSGELATLQLKSHLPLGLLGEGAEEARPDTILIHERGQLLMLTDGLWEAEDAAGLPWSQGGLQEALTDAPPQQRFEHLLACFQQHTAGQQVRDDAAFLLADIAHHEAQQRFDLRAPAVAAGAPPSVDENGWSVSMRFGARELRTLDAIPLLTSVVERLEAGKEHRRQVFVILSELFTNAVEHGLLGLHSSLKGGFEGFEAYMAERQRRLDALEGGHVEIGLERALIDGRAAIRIRVRDTGRGFDYGALDLAAFGQNATPYGRGILLASSLCYSLEFVGAGNEVVGYYCL